MDVPKASINILVSGEWVEIPFFPNYGFNKQAKLKILKLNMMLASVKSYGGVKRRKKRRKSELQN